MNAKQKNFITKKLIPFILREQGRGFGMEFWKSNYEPDTEIVRDDVLRKVPVCGTVCCIGGSITYLIGKRKASTAGAAIGLTEDQSFGLFYEWSSGGRHIGDDGCNYGWPIKFTEKFANASTAYQKAKVAASLLKEVVRTNGDCLKRG